MLGGRSMGIFGKLLTSYVLLSLFVVVVAGVVSFALSVDSITSETLAELSEQAQFMAEYSAQVDPSVDPLFFEKSQRDDFMVLEAYGDEFIAHRKKNPQSDWEITEIIDALDTELVKRVFAGETVLDTRYLEFFGNQIAFAIVPVFEADGSVEMAVMAYRTMSEIHVAALGMSMTLIVGVALAMLLSTVFAWFISRRFTRPLVSMNQTALRMAEGHYGDRVTVSARDEIGVLGGTLNLLSGRLDGVIANLRAEKRKLEQILLSLGEGVIAVDTEGEVMHGNLPALEVLEVKDFPALRESANPNHRMVMDAVRACIETGEKQVVAWVNESERNLEATVSAVMDGEHVTGAVVLLRDVSESARLEQLRRDYIANISHELRTPLTGIRGMVEPLIDGYMDTEEEKQDCYRVIYKETIRLEHLISDMLDVSRLQAGVARMELEEIGVEGILQAARRQILPRAQEAGIEVRVEAGANLTAMADEERVMQVLLILLDNALSFTPTGGAITLYARSEHGGEKTVIGVRDTGTGIESRDLPYIWERFYKADRSRMRMSGTGLGLAIAKLAVERMGGTIDVVTEVGKGSDFFVTLKATDEAE